MEEYFEELVTCPVCLEKLNSANLMLPCQHTFCKKCLEQIRRKDFRCPECRFFVLKEFKDLPSNLFVMRFLALLESYKMDKSKGKTPNNTTALASKSTVLGSPSIANSKSPLIDLGALDKSVIHPSMYESYPQGSNKGSLVEAVMDCLHLQEGYLSFDKGDLLHFVCHVDIHWIIAELKGIKGLVPMCYVRMPYFIPQARALSNVRQCEKEYLTFHEGDVITLLHHVEDSWAMGTTFSGTGLFPLELVELNQAAKNMLCNPSSTTQILKYANSFQEREGSNEMSSRTALLQDTVSVLHDLNSQKQDSEMCLHTAPVFYDPPAQDWRSGNNATLFPRTNYLSLSPRARSFDAAERADLRGYVDHCSNHLLRSHPSSTTGSLPPQIRRMKQMFAHPLIESPHTKGGVWESNRNVEYFHGGHDLMPPVNPLPMERYPAFPIRKNAVSERAARTKEYKPYPPFQPKERHTKRFNGKK